jgi:hypothetical protein
MLGNMQDAIPLTLWMIDLGSASKDLGKRADLGLGFRMGLLSRMEGR